MIEIDGKRVYTTLNELIEPAHTALLVVDMQRDFCLPGAVFDELGIDIGMYPAMIPRVARLLDGARQTGVSVIFVQMSVLPGHLSESPAQLRFNMRLHLGSRKPDTPMMYALEGSFGQQIIPELEPVSGEFVVKKHRSSGFWGTDLNMLLRSNGIETVVMSGCTTEGCVESTARDALFNDYYVVIAEDCVASDDRKQHEASLFLMRHRFDMATAEEILQTWHACSSLSDRPVPTVFHIGK